MFVSLFAAAFALLPWQGSPDAPPSTVLIPGGRTRIGIDVKDVERLVLGEDGAANYAGALIAETPHQELVIDSFWLMSTEVTQEQYGEYVTAVGGYPPETWCEEAIAAAARAFAAEEQRLESESRARGEAPPPRRVFDRREWWAANATACAWTIPAEDRQRPAVFVDYESARAYARWAGMRLPTEFEFQRAVRGDTAQTYPWGNDWDNEKYAATSLLKKKGGTFPVGSFPLGRTRQGVYDLAGNVWEWTSSRYTAYPGHLQRIFEVGYGNQRRIVNAVADFNAEQRVVVSGSYQQPNLMCRATTRRGTVRDQKTGALGFRCAANPRPGADMARYVLEDDFDLQLRPRVDGLEVEYAPDLAWCADAWRTRPTSSGSAPASYAIVTGYVYVNFTPVLQVPAPDLQTLRRRSIEDPVQLGLLSSNLPLALPDSTPAVVLEPGSYLVSYRARGTRRPGFPREVLASRPTTTPVEEALSLDVSFDHVIVSTLRGDPVTALRRSVEFGAEREGRMYSSALETTPPDAGGGVATGRAFTLDACIPCRTTKKGILLQIDARATALPEDLRWRR